MKAATRTLRLATKGENDVVDLTKAVQEVVTDSGLETGIVITFVAGSTTAITTLEFEAGLVRDFPEMLDRISPNDITYEHHKAWNDDNGRSHVKAALVGPSLTVPFLEGRLVVGTWQQIVLVELDTRSRDRTVIIEVLGE